MLKLTELISAEHIDAYLSEKKKEDALATLVGLLAKSGSVDNPAACVSALMDRENLASTGIGGNIAIPHVLLDDVSETVIAIGRSREGIGFGSLDGNPVNLIFLVVGPARQDLLHLQLLSKLARYLRDENYRNGLMEAKDAAEIIDIVYQYEKEDL